MRKVWNRSNLLEIKQKGNVEENIIAELNKIDNLTARIPKKLLPKMAIYNIPADLNKDTIIEAIFDQNDAITFQYQGDKEMYKRDISAKFKWGKRPDSKHWVFEVTPKLRKIMNRQRKVNIGWVRCNMEEYYSIIQCYKCCRYGHFAKECRSEHSYCNYYGEDHRYSDCKNKATAPSCINCIKAKAPTSAHKADNNTCTERGKIIKNIITKTNYE
ncbi:uncharacterized protein LOC111641289 [Centruroides sculpturatus]|uniref:uncharacterized protein LOC111641289 n=1 Tax=Centruroides sculpturatus TaxID=218467 RepID=UPI000C6DC234|nr:uncharacterized protein LOC111641289 [Centruroides sculpturatus]